MTATLSLWYNMVYFGVLHINDFKLVDAAAILTIQN